MIRKILLLMLVLGCMVQGVGAVVYTLEVNDTVPKDVFTLSVPLSYNYYYSYGALAEAGCLISIGYSVGTPSWIVLNSFINSSGSGILPSNAYEIIIHAGDCGGGLSSSGILSVSLEAPNIASGESCDGVGTFTYYQNDTWLGVDSVDGNYSFSIFDDVNYSINYVDGNISEWHNFTASGDEEWNPTDTCNNADFNFTNLSYTSPVKQYITSTVTVDINDTDGTISSAIARIDGSNYSMQFIGGEKWRYLFTGTNIIKNYYITNIYATDNEGGQDYESYNASYIHVESRTGGGGGGGGGGDSYPSDPTIPPPSEPCTLNCDDNDDGICDRNCDTDDDGICDVNCDDAVDRPADEDVPDDFKDLFEDFRDGDIPDDFWTDKNLRIHPASLNSTAFYTGWDKPQNVTYRFLTNKFIDSCEVTNGSCTIDQRFLVNFNTVIDGNTTGYRGMLTVSRTNETAQADIKINVINLCACKEITPWQLNISDEWAQKLVYFVRVKDGAIVCIRWWFMIALLILLLGIVWYDSNKK